MPNLSAVDLELRVPDRVLFSHFSMSVDAGQSVALVGPSGCGKTTLLRCLAGIVTPWSGRVLIDNEEISSLSPRKRAAMRLRHIGFVFQFGGLLEELTVTENVALPLLLQGAGRPAAVARAETFIRELGIGGRAGARPRELSGGEVQRAGIARALVSSPAVVLADEPTGALDGGNARHVADLLVGATRDFGAALVVATHNLALAALADTTLDLAAAAAAAPAAVEEA